MHLLLYNHILTHIHIKNLFLLLSMQVNLLNTHFKWLQLYDPNIGVPGFLLIHIAIRYFLMLEDMDRILSSLEDEGPKEPLAHSHLSLQQLRNMLDQGKDIIRVTGQLPPTLNPDLETANPETTNLGTANPGMVSGEEALQLHKRKMRLFLNKSREQLVKHFKRYCEHPALATAASFGEAPTSKVISKWITYGAIEANQANYWSPMNKRIIQMQNFQDFVKNNFPEGNQVGGVLVKLKDTKLFKVRDSAVPKILKAVVNGLDMWNSNSSPEATTSRRSILHIFGPCRSNSQAVERSVKHSAYVSSTGRKEKNRTIWAIAGNGMVTDTSHGWDDASGCGIDASNGIYSPVWIINMNEESDDQENKKKSLYRGPRRTRAIFNKASEIHDTIQEMEGDDNYSNHRKLAKNQFTESDKQYIHLINTRNLDKFTKELNSNEPSKRNARQKIGGYNFAPGVTGSVIFSTLRKANHSEAIREELSARGIASTVGDIRLYKELLLTLKKVVGDQDYGHMGKEARVNQPCWFDNKGNPKAFNPKSQADFSIPG